MRRDLDLVRSILIYVENADSEVDAGNMAAKRWSIESVAYHVGLVSCSPACAGMTPISGYAKIKCQPSAEKISSRLRHAKAQFEAMPSGKNNLSRIIENRQNRPCPRNR